MNFTSKTQQPFLPWPWPWSSWRLRSVIGRVGWLVTWLRLGWGVRAWSLRAILRQHMHRHWHTICIHNTLCYWNNYHKHSIYSYSINQTV